MDFDAIKNLFKEFEIDEALTLYYEEFDNLSEDEKEPVQVQFINELKSTLAKAQKKDKYDAVYACAKELLELYPNEEKYLLAAAQSCEVLKKYDLRVEYLRRLEPVASDKGYCYRLLGHALKDVGNTLDAIEYLSKYIRNGKPTEKDLYAFAILAIERFKDVLDPVYIEIAQRFINKLTNKKHILKCKIELCKAQKKYDEAEELINEYISLPLSNDEYWEYSEYYLLKDEIPKGMEIFKYRPKKDFKILTEKKEWMGEPFGGTLAILSEKEIVQDIFFARFLKNIPSEQKFILILQNEEIPIFKISFPEIEIKSEDDIENLDIGQYTFIGDIPKKLNIIDFKSEKYIELNTKDVKKFAKTNGCNKKVLSIGFEDYKNDFNSKNLDVYLLSNLSKVPAKFCSLKENIDDETVKKEINKAAMLEIMGGNPEYIENYEMKFYVENYGKNIHSLYDKALAISNVDVVISGNNLTSMLAISMGKRTITIGHKKLTPWYLHVFNNNGEIYNLEFDKGYSWINLDNYVYQILWKYVDNKYYKNFILNNEKRYENLLEKSPENDFALSSYAGILSCDYVKKYDKAREIIEDALEIRRSEEYFSQLLSIMENIYDKDEYSEKVEEVLEKYKTGNGYMAYAFALLAKRNYTEGLSYYRKRNSITSRLNKKVWTGEEDLSDSTILVIADEGLGDNILFGRYLNNLSKIAKHVKYIARKELYDLFKYNFPDVEILTEVKDFEKIDCDYCVTTMDLPTCFKFDGTNYEQAEGYMNVDDKLVEEFKEKYVNKETFNIGIMHRGISTQMLERNVLLQQLLPLTEIEGVQLYSFQYKEPDYRFKNTNVINLGKNFESFLDTAVAVKSMDLMVSTDNGTLNLSGALGQKTFMLLRHIPDWRWPLDRKDDIGWYKNVKPFYNDIGDDWDKTIQRLKKEVEKLVKKSRK